MSQKEHLAWFSGRIPKEWASGPLQVETDRDEILVIIPLASPEMAPETSPEEQEVATEARVDGFRTDTRGQRISIAREAERRFGRKVSWGVKLGDDTYTYRTLAAPAMTRLRMKERRVLDTLVDSGMARSRAEALAWCVRLVGKHEEEWLSELREALGKVGEVRAKREDL
jgi:hypothetical protein